MKIGLFRGLFAAFFVFSVSRYGMTAVPACYRDLEVNFFRPHLVNEALSLHAISQSNWSLINIELQRNVKRVPELLRERARKMDPNPLEIAFPSLEASQLLHQVLFEVFSQTLSLFYITNQNKIAEIFQYISERQRQRLIACFGEELEQ